jgi:hypothetical protein
MAVVRVVRGEVGVGAGRANRAALVALAFTLGPTAGHFREDLHRGRTDGFGARRSFVSSACD